MGLSPFDPYPIQQEILQCTDRYRATNKPRQCGFSTTFGAEAAHAFDNVPGAQILVLSKDFPAARNFHKYVYNILYSSRENGAPAPKLLKENECETTNANGSRIVSLAASKDAGRSFSPTHLYFDEMAFATYARDIWQAANASLAKTRGRATIISTPKGRANLFAEIFMERGHKGFTTFAYAWWDVPDYNPYYAEYVASTTRDERNFWIEKARGGEWYRATRPGYTSLQWAQEFEGAFDADMGTVFSYRQLERTFHKNYLSRREDPRGLLSHWYTSEHQDNHLYSTGIDLGRKNDPTVVVTYDYTTFPARVVDFKYVEAGRCDWSMLGKILIEHLEHWKPEAKHDGTGVGDSLSEVLLGYSSEFFFTKAQKQNIIERVQLAMDNHVLHMPKIPVLYDEHKIYTWDDTDIVQDTVMANALAVASFYDLQPVTTLDSFDFVGAAR